MNTPSVFQPDGPLPGVGVTVLEASAGTGKTHAVAGLATRFLAEGVVRLDELLVITFSRAATQELRDRVRDRLVEAQAMFAGDPAAAAERADDLARLARTATGEPVDAAIWQERRERIDDAVATFDAATIATTHEFCHAVLRSLGVAGDSDGTDVLRDDVSAMVDDVIDDLYLARFAGSSEIPPIDYRQARRAARAALNNPHAHLRPTDSEDPVAAALVEFADAARREVERRKRRAAVLTFDDLLSRLATALQGESSAAADRMRTRWKVVLVDEFQDTDEVQWAVLRQAFAATARLVLIGDPKQAIYAFRGGDTPTYLAAVADAEVRTLTTNWRSDRVVVDALRELTKGAQLGDERIVVHEVQAAEKNATSRLSAGGGVRLRQVRREDFSLTKSGVISIPLVRNHIAKDLAADIARQLDTVELSVDGKSRPLRAGDIAILVHSVSREAALIQAELSALGIPSVINSSESVMNGQAAQDWWRLLAALETPQSPSKVRSAALTPFFGTTAADLLADDRSEELTEQLSERARSWLDLYRTRGVAGVLAAATADGMAERVLRNSGGERHLTDLHHVGQLLHQAAHEQRLGLAGLIAWLREAIAEGNRNDTRRRRLDVDEDAVQFLTIHGAKGMEYPVVYLPQVFDRNVQDWPTEHAYHDAEGRCLDVANSAVAKAKAREEEAQEELRLLYVALTRARSQVTAWWAPTYNAGHGALTRLLFGRRPGEAVVPDRVPVPADDHAVDAALAAWAAAGALRVEASTVIAMPARQPVPAGALAARRFTRQPDDGWRRTSYSGLIRAEEQGGGTVTEAEVRATDDEETDPLAAAAGPDQAAAGAVEQATAVLDPLVAEALAQPSPMAALPAGATLGSLVHAVLETFDPQAPDPDAELRSRIEEERRWWSVTTPTDELATALAPVLATPLGPLADSLTLNEITMRDRLCELDFEIPMARGDAGEVGTGLPLRRFADALRRHLGADDPIRRYADRLESPALGGQELRGYLSGSIDVVLRVGGEDPRFLVVDYKTNNLAEPGEPILLGDYTPAKVREAMLHSHYPLQALLYSVVLHRYLRWRLPGYTPHRHLGGVLYLYLRGMAGPQTPVVDGVPCGVFSWKPPAELVLELSAILDGEADR